MIAAIRITGQVKVTTSIKETLGRLNMLKKYTCVVIENPTAVDLGMIKKVSDFIAYGEISEDMYAKLKAARGKEGKKYYRLHPPRGGIDSKKHYGVDKGVLGNNKGDINKLVERML